MPVQRTICPHCLHPYVVDINGIAEGCDDCLSIIRNTDCTIAEEVDTDDFLFGTPLTEAEVKSLLDDMEKA